MNGVGEWGWDVEAAFGWWRIVHIVTVQHLGHRSDPFGRDLAVYIFLYLRNREVCYA